MKGILILALMFLNTGLLSSDQRDFKNKSQQDLREFFRFSSQKMMWAIERPFRHNAGAGIDTWTLGGFRIRLRPKAGFSLAGIASLKLVPEFEMSWSRRQSPLALHPYEYD